MKLFNLYVGLDSDTLTRSQVIDALSKTLNKHVDGYTLSDGIGYWQGQLEPCKIVAVATVETRAIMLAYDICHNCEQCEVMVVLPDGDVEFVCRSDMSELQVSELNDIGSEYVAEYERQTAAEKAHIGHVGRGGVAGHSCGEIFPWHIVLIGSKRMELWGPGHNGDNPAAVEYYHGGDYCDCRNCGRLFGDAHRRLERVALAKLESAAGVDAVNDRWDSLS